MGNRFVISDGDFFIRSEAEEMKWIGAGLILAAGYLLSQYLILPAMEHLQILEEGEVLFRILESEIRNRKTPLPELFSQISRKTESVWHDFFFDLSEELKKCTDFDFADSFERLLDLHTAPVLTEEERQLILNAGRNFLSDDLMYQRKAIDQLSDQLKKCMEAKREKLKNQKKVYRALCLSMSALIVIILI